MTLQQHRDAVLLILEQHGWKLVADQEPFLQAVLAEAQSRCADTLGEVAASAIERATIHQYCLVLYDACGDAGTRRQRGAFEELGTRLRRVALIMTKDEQVADDCTQIALMNIWKSLKRVKDPGCFLNYCDQVVVRSVLAYQRKEARQPARDEPPAGDDDEENPLQELPDPTSTDDGRELIDVMNAELRKELIEAIRACLDNENHQTVIIELFLNNKTVKEVTELLNTRPGNVDVWKKRALNHLRECERVLQLFEEWLMRHPQVTEEEEPDKEVGDA